MSASISSVLCTVNVLRCYNEAMTKVKVLVLIGLLVVIVVGGLVVFKGSEVVNAPSEGATSTSAASSAPSGAAPLAP